MIIKENSLKKVRGIDNEYYLYSGSSCIGHIDFNHQNSKLNYITFHESVCISSMELLDIIKLLDEKKTKLSKK